LLIKTHRVFLENRCTRRRVEPAESYRSAAPDSPAFCAGFLFHARIRSTNFPRAAFRRQTHMTPRDIRRKTFLPIALVSAALLTACATPGASTDTGTDAVNRHALVRTAPPAPSWSALHEQLAKATAGLPGVELGRIGDAGFHVQIPVADGFASGSAQIRPALGSALDALAPPLAAESGVAIRVVGHTDSQGSEMVNLRLSITRAEAVVAWLRDRGIALDRLGADGRGEADPLTSNATAEGRVRNRRIELILSPMP
jgi:outer membrane protein OmpA-like peptidoglycan-associated protein